MEDLPFSLAGKVLGNGHTLHLNAKFLVKVSLQLFQLHRTTTAESTQFPASSQLMVLKASSRWGVVLLQTRTVGELTLL